MKKLLPLALLATSAFAHEVPFNRPDFLKMTSGDRPLAQQFYFHCAGTGDVSSCLKDLSGGGNLRQEAVLKCEQRAARLAFTIRGAKLNQDVPGARGHQVDGKDWHEDYQRDGGGRSHRHEWHDNDREKAQLSAVGNHLAAWRTVTDGLSKESTITTSVGSSKGMDFGLVGEVGRLLLSVTGKWDVSTAKSISEKTGIPVKEIERAYELGLAAKADPSIEDVKPTYICYQEERNCRGGDKKSNDNYNPNAEKNKEAEKKASEEKKRAELKAEEDKKLAEAKKLEDEKKAENPTVAEEEEKETKVELIGPSEKWTGIDAKLDEDDTMVATPADSDLVGKTIMEQCIDAEERKLIQTVGSSTLDPNGFVNEQTEQSRADSLSKFGYCDVKVMGQEFCRMKKFKEDSVPTNVDLGMEKLEKAGAALDALKMWGQCDKAALGAKFCKDYEHQWIITPTGFEKIEHETSVKSGDIPHFAPQPDFEVKDEPVRDFTINPNFN